MQRVLQLLAGISSEYQEAFDEQGKVVRPMDIDETRLLLAEVRDLTVPLTAGGDPGLGNLLGALSTLVDQQVPPAVITAFVEVLRRYLIQWTGVRETIVPPERPSLARGRELFQENCVGCHGVSGAGDGADAKRLGIKPADFTDLTFMRGQTPRDAFNVISLGRQKGGMPSWGEALAPQQVWDLVSYIWSVSRTPASLAAGQRVYEAQCAGCHGATGDPADVVPTAGVQRPPRSLSALLEIAERSDSDLFAVVSDGGRSTAMPAFAPRLAEDERWAVVTFARTLSLEGAPGAAAQPMEPDRGAQMAEVRRLLDAAVDAQRRGDPSATALATNAYIRLEPLEKPLAEIDEVRMEALELQFIAFRKALHDPTTGDPGLLGRRLAADLAAAAELLPPPGVPRRHVIGWARPGLAVVAGIMLLAVAYLIWTYTRRPIASQGHSS